MAFGNFIIGTVAALFASKAAAVDNGLAITPQMGCKLRILIIEALADST